MQPLSCLLRRTLSGTLLVALLGGAASATLTVTVISPNVGDTGTASGGTPVFFEAYATSPGCAAGISAMRIYSNPGVDVYTVNGGHLETFIPLALGSYNATVQAWDNCGAVAKTPVNLNVTYGNISVYLPTSEVGYGPLHIAASSQSGCNHGISAMRLYTAPYVGVYTVNSNSLDAFVTLPPATYNITIVAWDHCGGVFTSNLSTTTTGAPDGYVYGIYGSGGSVGTLQVDETGTLVNPNGSNAPPTVPVPGVNSVVADPGGWFVYASGTKGIYAYEIDPTNGILSPVAGSPYTAGGLSQVLMDQSGNYLYAISPSAITTYRINRSNGKLTSTGQSVKFPPVTQFNVATFASFLYVLGDPSGQIWGYSLNDTTGALGAIPGTPLTVNTGVDAIVAQDYHVFVNDNGNYGSGFNGIYAYDMNATSGALSSVPGSPFAMEYQNQNFNFVNMWGDWENRYLWEWQLDTTDNNNAVYPIDVNPDGSITLTTNFQLGGVIGFPNFTEDLTGNYVFAQWSDAFQQPSPPNDVGVQSLYISNGKLVPDTSTILPETFAIQAVSRKDQN